jgi:DNA-binding MarR family transcriptional regulator
VPKKVDITNYTIVVRDSNRQIASMRAKQTWKADDLMEVRSSPDISILTSLLSFQLRMLSHSINRAYNEAFAETEASSGTGKLTTLLLVSANPGISQTEAGRVQNKDRAAMVRIIDQLEQSQLITRSQDPDERRRHRLVLTRRGATEVKRYMAIAQAYDSGFFSVLSEAERKSLVRIVQKLRRNHQPETLGLNGAAARRGGGRAQTDRSPL